MNIINPPSDGFKVEFINNIAHYSRHPVKLTFTCKCGVKIDAWPDLIDRHKLECDYSE